MKNSHVPLRCAAPLLAAGLLFTMNARPEHGQPTRVYPASDPSNKGDWGLNQEVSDEFDGARLNTSKWHVQGTDGAYRSNFIGRPPSQFSTANVRVEDGMLKLSTRWEPDFDFSGTNKEGKVFENITTAAVISKKPFLHGYMEIKCKAADASITSSFWATGGMTELDVFEFLGAPAQQDKAFLEKEFMFTVIDWTKPQESRRMWRDQVQLDWRVADDFHVYGCEWDENALRFYADGKLVGSAMREELGERWIMTKPIWVWVDSETFPWHGIPEASDLPVDFEIEYIRVWQKETGGARRTLR